MQVFPRAEQPDFWVGFISNILDLFPDTWDYVLIPDCRFPNEVNTLKDGGFNVTHLRVIRDNFESPLTPEQQAHPSETALDNMTADYYIRNNGSLTDLQVAVIKFLLEFND